MYKYFIWSCRKYWLGWLWQDIRSIWYKFRWGINIDPFHGSTLPFFGKGDFVSVIKKGGFIDIIAHKRPKVPTGTIRVIPCQYNHGLMIEFIRNEKVYWRSHLDYDMLFAIGHNGKENEGKNPKGSKSC